MNRYEIALGKKSVKKEECIQTFNFDNAPSIKSKFNKTWSDFLSLEDGEIKRLGILYSDPKNIFIQGRCHYSSVLRKFFICNSVQPSLTDVGHKSFCCEVLGEPTLRAGLIVVDYGCQAPDTSILESMGISPYKNYLVDYMKTHYESFGHVTLERALPVEQWKICRWVFEKRIMERLFELQRTEGDLLGIDIVVCCSKNNYDFYKSYDIYPCEDSLWKKTPEFKLPDMNNYKSRLRDSLGVVISGSELRRVLGK